MESSELTDGWSSLATQFWMSVMYWSKLIVKCDSKVFETADCFYWEIDIDIIDNNGVWEGWLLTLLFWWHWGGVGCCNTTGWSVWQCCDGGRGQLWRLSIWRRWSWEMGWCSCWCVARIGKGSTQCRWWVLVMWLEEVMDEMDQLRWCNFWIIRCLWIVLKAELKSKMCILMK